MSKRNHKTLAKGDFELYKMSNLSTVLFCAQGSQQFERFLKQPPCQQATPPPEMDDSLRLI